MFHFLLFIFSADFRTVPIKSAYEIEYLKELLFANTKKLSCIFSRAELSLDEMSDYVSGKRNLRLINLKNFNLHLIENTHFTIQFFKSDLNRCMKRYGYLIVEYENGLFNFFKFEYERFHFLLSKI